jgi:cytochrome P450
VGPSRVVLHETILANGAVLPQGSVVSLAPKPLHFNPKVYPDPMTFDPFRFAKQGASSASGKLEPADVRNAFTSLSNDYIVFGVGMHACPGRFLYVVPSSPPISFFFSRSPCSPSLSSIFASHFPYS